MGKKKVAARSDNDISDEAAGRARIELAAASKARKAEEAARLKAEVSARVDQPAAARIHPAGRLPCTVPTPVRTRRERRSSTR